MGLFNALKEYLYFNGSNERGRIYKETIRQIPLSFFKWQARVKIGGEVKDLSGEDLRDFIADLAHNGVSLAQLDYRLKQAGLRDGQYALRQRVLKMVEKNISHRI
jgi:hypothetical protein